VGKMSNKRVKKEGSTLKIPKKFWIGTVFGKKVYIGKDVEETLRKNGASEEKIKELFGDAVSEIASAVCRGYFKDSKVIFISKMKENPQCVSVQ